MWNEALLGELHMPLKTLCFMSWEGSNVHVSISLLHLSLSLYYWSLNSSLVQTKKWREKETKQGGKEKKLTNWSELLTFFSLAYFALWSGG